ncbi:MAG: hypothetical protein M0R73_12600 [Dehalococcoidia bacterium]|nr:hypothetical protein [Dehalococcoidia bacterium]
MPETPVTFVIDADEISPEKFTLLLREFLGVLSEVDRELSDFGDPSLLWRITSLSYNSPAAVGLMSRPKGKRPDIGPQVITTSLAGLHEIQKERQRPIAFNDDALTHVREMARQTGNGIRHVIARSDLYPNSPPVTVTRDAAATVDRVLPMGYSFGSVEGRLEGLDIHRQPRFTVYDAVTGRAVRCYFDTTELDKVKAAVGRKVIVSGKLRRDPEGRPQQVRQVDFFEVLDVAPPHPPRDAAGAFGEVEDPENYLERLRDIG